MSKIAFERTDSGTNKTNCTDYNARVLDALASTFPAIPNIPWMPLISGYWKSVFRREIDEKVANIYKNI